MRLHSLQEALKTFFGKGDLQKGLDGDEAACLGSALYAASLSTAFRLRKFGVKDIATAAISVLRPSLPVPLARIRRMGGILVARRAVAARPSLRLNP